MNDAGFGETGYFTDTDLATELAIIQVNAAALVQLTKLYLRDMVARNAGRILQVGSLASFTPSPCQAVYAATKAFVLSFTEAVQHELKQQKSAVTMTVLCPPPTDTNFFRVAHAENTRAASHTVSARTVAEEGYDVLMEGGARSLPTMGAKVNFFTSLVLPDSMLATIMNNQLHPVEISSAWSFLANPKKGCGTSAAAVLMLFAEWAGSAASLVQALPGSG